MIAYKCGQKTKKYNSDHFIPPKLPNISYENKSKQNFPIKIKQKTNKIEQPRSEKIDGTYLKERFETENIDNTDINISNLIDFKDPPTPPLWHYRKPISDIMSISDIEEK